FRARQEQEKFDRLIRFAEELPELREQMAEHFELDSLAPGRVCAIAVRLINLGWFRVGSEEYARRYRSFGITTLRKRHGPDRGRRILLSYPGKRDLRTNGDGRRRPRRRAQRAQGAPWQRPHLSVPQ